jgi:hypothetical protein
MIESSGDIAMYPEIRLSRVGLKKIDGSFPVFSASGGFARDAAHTLHDTLPPVTAEWDQADDTLLTDRTHILRANTPLYDRWISEASDWRDVLAAFHSNEFRRDAACWLHKDLMELASKNLLTSPLVIELLGRSASPEEFGDKLAEATHTDFLVNALGQSDLNTPHTDGGAKFLTLLIYYPDQPWDPRLDGGQTLFYDSGDNYADAPWFSSFGNSRVPADLIPKFESDSRIFHASRCEPNEWCLFVKTKNSFHGVRPLTCGEGKFRRAVVVNIRYNKLR